MKALYFDQHGSIENLRYGDVDDPMLVPNEVIIRVKACALNHLDLWVLSGWPGLNLQMPHIGGADVAGEIVELGKNVSGWKIGQRVIVNPGIVSGEDEWTRRGEECLSPHYKILGEGKRGGFAQYVSVPEQNVFSLPEHVRFQDGAACLLAGLTSWRMLKVRAQLRAGETVLVVGAGGGVNSLSIQLAKHLGAEVIALSSSEEKLKNALALGATHGINYRKNPDWSRAVRDLTKGRGVDVVIDNVGAKTFEQSIRSVARGGRIVTVGNTSGPSITFDNRLIFTKQITILGSTMGNRGDFENIIRLVFEGRIKPVIDSQLALKDGISAYNKLLKGEQFGKIILVP